MCNSHKQGKIKLLDSINTKIIVVIILSILPLNLLVIVSIAKSIAVIEDQARLSMENVANLYVRQLDNRIFSINYYFYDLYERDADFIRLTGQLRDDAYVIAQTAVAQKFRTHIETTNSADGYFFQAKEAKDSLFVMPGSRFASDPAASRSVRKELEKWLLRSDFSGMNRWSLVVVDGKQWLLRVYVYDDYCFGAVISIDEICRDVAAAVDYPGLDVAVTMGQITQPGKGFLCADSVSGEIDLTLFLSVPENEIIQTLPRLQRFGIVIAFAYLLLIPLLILALNHILLQPLRKIRSALLRLKAGDRDYRISAHSYSEEFRSINQSFNEMADNIETLKIENYEKEMARQKMELRNLQLQIRPHFLLNMFKLVHSLAQIQEYESIQKLILYLSNYFRYIFRSAEELEPFDREYSLIREYLEISAIRYPDQFTVRYEVQDSVLNVKVPPLIIHNFIENIFKHALYVGRTVHIVLSASCENGWARFIIFDDGTGMDAKIIDYINDGAFATEKSKRTHVGIYNSYQRLQYFYGEQSTLRVEPVPGGGTRITVLFPYDLTEVDMV